MKSLEDLSKHNLGEATFTQIILAQGSLKGLTLHQESVSLYVKRVTSEVSESVTDNLLSLVPKEFIKLLRDSLPIAVSQSISIEEENVNFGVGDLYVKKAGIEELGLDIEEFINSVNNSWKINENTLIAKISPTILPSGNPHYKFYLDLNVC